MANVSESSIAKLLEIMTRNRDPWYDLPTDFLDRILSMVEDDMDMVRCRDVCLSWRAVASEVYHRRWKIPKLLFRDDEGVHLRDVFTSSDAYLPEEDCRRICNSTNGWLLMYEFDQLEASFSLCLRNPISKREVALPSISVAKYETILKIRPEFFLDLEFIRKGITSTSPPLEELSTSSFLVLIICGGGIDPRLAFCGPGSAEWNYLELEGSSSGADDYINFIDLVYCRGQFYAADEQGRVYRCELDGSDPRVIEEVMTDIRYSFLVKNLYLVESLSGELLLVLGKRKYVDGIYENVSFEVHKIDFATKTMRKMTGLGDQALFIGRDGSSSVLTVDGPGASLTGNCIFFIANVRDRYPCDYHGVNMYDMDTDKVIRLSMFEYSSSSPLHWIIPTF